MAAAAEKTKPYTPLSGLANDGWSTEDGATRRAADLRESSNMSPALTPRLSPQPTQGPGLINTFVCNCTDCRKIIASMIASNFTVADMHLTHVRGRDNLKTFGQAHSVASHKTMTNYSCSTCGTLMYRVGAAFRGQSILRIGTVDDFSLHETKLKPQSGAVYEGSSRLAVWPRGRLSNSKQCLTCRV